VVLRAWEDSVEGFAASFEELVDEHTQFMVNSEA
jgi:hypothetical protein